MDSSMSLVVAPETAQPPTSATLGARAAPTQELSPGCSDVQAVIESPTTANVTGARSARAD